MKKSEKIISELFTTEVLTSKEMTEVRGGTRPKTRDKDIYEFEEE